MSDQFLEKCRNYEKIISDSGISLSAYDQLGNSFDILPINIALFAAILTRENLSDYEKSIMLYGVINAPTKLNFSQKIQDTVA